MSGSLWQGAIQERGDTRPLSTGDKMGMVDWQAAQEGVERRQAGREGIGARRAVGGPADGRRRQGGKGDGGFGPVCAPRSSPPPSARARLFSRAKHARMQHTRSDIVKVIRALAVDGTAYSRRETGSTARDAVESSGSAPRRLA